MCTICRKFKKGTLDVQEAREELEEQLEYLSEDHIEEIEEMLFRAEDTYEYMMERRRSRIELGEEEDDSYPLEEDLQEEEFLEDEDE